MEKQFKYRQESMSRLFLPRQLLLGKYYRNGKEKWTQRYVIRRSSNVIYDVDVQSSFLV